MSLSIQLIFNLITWVNNIFVHVGFDCDQNALYSFSCWDVGHINIWYLTGQETPAVTLSNPVEKYLEKTIKANRVIITHTVCCKHNTQCELSQFTKPDFCSSLTLCIFENTVFMWNKSLLQTFSCLFKWFYITTNKTKLILFQPVWLSYCPIRTITRVSICCPAQMLLKMAVERRKNIELVLDLVSNDAENSLFFFLFFFNLSLSLSLL